MTIITNREQMIIEKKLALLQGWHNIRQTEYGRLVGNFLDGTGNIYIPCWARSWEDCGKLMLERDIYPRLVTTTAGQYFTVAVRTPSDEETAIETKLADHPNKASAFKYCVVQAAIAQLPPKEPK